MTGYRFEHKLKDLRELSERTPGEVDAYIGAPLGTCSAWESGAVGKPEEVATALIAHFLQVWPSALDSAIRLEDNSALLTFARNFEAAVNLGQYQSTDAPIIWHEGRKARAFRGGDDDQFWQDLLERKQRPQGLI